MSWSMTASAIPRGTNSSTITATAAGSVQLPVSPVLSLSMARRAANGTISASPVSEAGTVVQLVLTAISAGNVALYNVSLGVPGLDASLICTGNLSVVHVLEAVTCFGNFTYNQEALEAGTRNFTAVGSATNLVSSVSSDVTVEVAAFPRLQVNVDATNCSTPTKLPGSVVCGVLLFNSGNMCLANVSVSGNNNNCAFALLEPKNTVHCSMSRTLSQEDYDAGFVNVTANGASAVPFGPVSPLPTAPPDTARVMLNQNASLDLSASSDKGYVVADGDNVTVAFTAGNTGSVTLRNATFTFSPAVSSVSCASSGALLADGSVQLSSLAVDRVMNCSGVLYFDQDRLEAGPQRVRVTGAATGGNVTVSASSQDVIITPFNSPGLTLDLLGLLNCSLPASAGGFVVCPVMVQNSGNVRLQNVSVADVPGCNFTLLQPAEKQECQLQQLVSQTDFDAAEDTNTSIQLAVEGSAVPKGSNKSTIIEFSVETVSLQSVLDAALQLSNWSLQPAVVSEAGDSVSYFLALNNSGNVKLHSVQLTVPALQGNTSTGSIRCVTTNGGGWPPDSDLPAAEQLMCGGNFTFSQEAIEVGNVSLSARATAGPQAAGYRAQSMDLLPAIQVVDLPSLAVSVDTNSCSVPSQAEEALNCTAVVVNSGNVRLSNVSLDSSPNCSIPSGGVLLPKHSANCTISIVSTQDDIEAGNMNWAVSATAIPWGPNISTVTATAAGSVTLLALPVLRLHLLVANCTLPATVGTSAVCPVVVWNGGNVRLQNVSVAGAPGCDMELLRPAEQQSCQLHQPVSQADFAAAEDNNTLFQLSAVANALSEGSNSSAVTATDTAAVSLQTVLRAVVQISHWSVHPALVSAAGNSVSYSLAVSNSGNMRLHALQVTVPRLQGNTSSGSITCVAANGQSWPANSNLAAAEQLTCSGSFIFDQDAIEAGPVVPQAFATASNQAQSMETLPGIDVLNLPSLDVVTSTIICSVPSKAGVPLNCTAEVFNSGNVRLRNVSLGSGSQCTNPLDGISPNTSSFCSISIVSTQHDFEAGSMSWATTATATPRGTNSSTITATAAGSVQLPVSPVLSLSMVRRAANDSNSAPLVSEAGTVVELVLTAINVGNVALQNVSLRVPELGTSLVCSSSLSVLLVSDAVECSGNFTYDQNALEAGPRDLTAVGTAANLISSVSSDPPVTVGVAAVPRLQVDVDANNCTARAKLPGSVVCDVLMFNSGNMRLANVSVSGDNNTCAVALLEPNSTVHCSMSRTLTQEDYDAGFVNVTANGASAVPFGPESVLPIVPSDTATVVLNQNASLDLSARSDKGYVVVAGDSVTVKVTAGNTGSVTLRNASFTISPALSNVSCGSSGAAIAGDGSVQLPSLAWGTLVSCSGLLAFDQDRLEAGPQLVRVNGTASSVSGNVSATSQDVFITPITSPNLTLLVANCTLPASAGASVMCPVLVQNSGNVRLQNVSVSGAFGCGFTLLWPGQQQMCQLQNVVHQADFDAAEDYGILLQLSVSASALPKGSNSSTITTSDTETVSLDSVLHPAIQISKWTVQSALVSAAGDNVSYSLTLINNGTVKLHALQLTIPELQGNTSTGSITCVTANGYSWPAGSDLAAAEQVTCSGNFTFDQVSIDKDGVAPTAVVTARNMLQEAFVLPAIQVAHATVVPSPSPSTEPSPSPQPPGTELSPSPSPSMSPGPVPNQNSSPLPALSPSPLPMEAAQSVAMNVTFPMDYNTLRSSPGAMQQFANDVANNTATALRVDPNWVSVTNISSGSVIADIVVNIPNTASNIAQLDTWQSAIKDLVSNPDTAFAAVKSKYNITMPVKATATVYTASGITTTGTDSSVTALTDRISTLIQGVIGMAAGCGGALVLVALALAGLALRNRVARRHRMAATSFDATAVSQKYGVPSLVAAPTYGGQQHRAPSPYQPTNPRDSNHDARAYDVAMLQLGLNPLHGVERSAASTPEGGALADTQGPQQARPQVSLLPGSGASPGAATGIGRSPFKYVPPSQPIGRIPSPGQLESGGSPRQSQGSPSGTATPASTGGLLAPAVLAASASPSPARSPQKVPRLPQLPDQVLQRLQTMQAPSSSGSFASAGSFTGTPPHSRCSRLA